MTLKLFRAASVAVLGVSLLMSQPRSAFAQTAEQKAQAKEHFQNARRLYDVGRYADSIEEYQKAYLNVEDPVFLYNIAQAHRLNNQRDEAIRFYKNYLRRAPAAANRGEVETKIKEMEREIAEGKTGPVTTPPPNNTVVTPPNNTVVTPPNNTVVVPPPPPPNNDVTPPPVLPPPVNDGIGGVGPVANLTDGAAPSSGTGDRKLAYGLLIGGGTFVALGAVFGAAANSKAKAVETQTTFDPSVEKAGKAFNAAAIAFGLVGAVAGGVGLYLLLRGGDGGATERAAGRSKSPRLALFPALAPGYAGAGASVLF